MKKIIYILLVIVLLLVLTVFPYLFLIIFCPLFDAYALLLFIYIIISGIFLGKYWWHYVYVLDKHPRKGRPFFLPKKSKRKSKKKNKK
ncbi:MAG: hypothetical protein PHI37_01840 [Candidatus Gracilibacteria bacterium]|nr:hypothetical protein [Candidatus Gracilibacteria bacterium]